ncbi:hypothetical protein CFP65_7078 [Kitasatospora sp. MMS16-BH015]|uniref:Na+/H+ antiporter subunit E n=1 Tax=Kitasatospora sp. MMS16-BH015 TaxID=2018025 RepID=UPI000CA16846|nr:Na+/H+ antiporter subunit E [Kitasatospora sp. MMS16-BH015]AUG81682.1 hypothetical protein CFP65_7078 [Kitasatospora sp. MMS16-BH015]
MAAALGALGAVAVHRASGATPGPPARALRALRAFPWTLLAETGRLAVLLLHPRTHGPVFRELTLAPGAGPAWAAALLSATPGAYAVATDGRTLTVHALDSRVSPLEHALTGEPT